ncbi:MAG: D-inositol-3-phosphate glycosyltransferase [Verrucomicrobiae bacterium]|nr:D-inositol-3-phosphate glycosyltransferase [Verrucomicrobiae bacterium]
MSDTRSIKVAVASSGLGHISRGIETWANDLGIALHQRGVNVTLFKGGGQSQQPFERVVRCWQRDRSRTKLLTKLCVRGGWRFGLGSAYQIEQTSFARRLIPQLRTGRFDVVHMQDPWVAWLLERARRSGRHQSQVILAHGTEEPFEFLQQFTHLQELAPYYLENDQRAGLDGKHWYAIPNFVNVDQFSPNGSPLSRASLGISEDAFVILTVAAIKRTHKRVHVAIDETVRLRATHPNCNIHLVVAGAKERETEEVIAFGREQLGAAVTFLPNFDRERMPEIYRMANVLAHAALVEMMPIALLEATASGLPVVAHQWPVIQWIVGAGGTCVNAEQPGQLAQALGSYLDENQRQTRAAAARARAVALFSEEVVLKQILRMYEDVLSKR